MNGILRNQEMLLERFFFFLPEVETTNLNDSKLKKNKQTD